MQTDCVEHHDVDTAPNDETFHEIEAVEFRLAGSDARQIPAFGRRGTPNPSTSIECPATRIT